MAFSVVALYRFVSLPDAADLKPRIERLCADWALKGSILLAPEGINGSLAGSRTALAAFLDALRRDAVFGGRFTDLALNFSAAAVLPFGRLKVRVKPEIVTFDAGATDPNRVVGQAVPPRAWHRLIEHPDVTVIDTRNAFEVALGSFAGAIDPKLERFSDFKAYADLRLAPARRSPVALFCTGGIRCEKATSYLVARGFDQVYQLKGGILHYLATMPEAESRWTGHCFVFDGRVALGHGLAEMGVGQDA